jgi:hypothetical protein
MDILKIIIAGGRDFEDYNFLKFHADIFVNDLKKEFPDAVIQIVSGGAKGVDSLGERFAEENGYDKVIFKADWSKYRRAAGPIRNAEMASWSTHLLSFWNGTSKGTKSMINLAKKENCVVRVIKIEDSIKTIPVKRKGILKTLVD